MPTSAIADLANTPAPRLPHQYRWPSAVARFGPSFRWPRIFAIELLPPLSNPTANASDCRKRKPAHPVTTID